MEKSTAARVENCYSELESDVVRLLTGSLSKGMLAPQSDFGILETCDGHCSVPKRRFSSGLGDKLRPHLVPEGRMLGGRFLVWALSWGSCVPGCPLLTGKTSRSQVEDLG